MKLAIHLPSLGFPFKQALHTAARLGVQAVEIDARTQLNPRDLSNSGVRHIRKMLDDLNLRVSAVSFPTRRGYHVPQDLEPRIEATKHAMQLAYQLGAPLVVNHVGRVPTEPDDPDWQRLREALTDLGTFGQHVGALLAAETGSEEGADLARLLDSLSAGSVAVDFNPGQLIVNGFAPSDAAVVLGPRIRHVHAVDGVEDPGSRQGLDVPLGQGSVDFPELAALLEEHHYRGYWTVKRENPTNPLEEIRQAVEYLNEL